MCLSFAQQRLWFLHQMTPDSAAYNLPSAFRLTGPLDRAALEQSFQEIVRRHDVLRTTFLDLGSPLQVISPPGAWQLSEIDLSQIPQASAPRDRANLLMTRLGSHSTWFAGRFSA